MKCPNCGNELEEGKLLCEHCGEEVKIVPDFDIELCLLYTSPSPRDS